MSENKNPLESLFKFQEHIKQIVASNPVRKFLEEQEKHQQIVRQINESVIARIKEQQKAIAEGIKAAATDVDKFKLILIEFGIPPFDEISIPQIRRVVSFYDEHGSEATQELLEDFILELFDNEIIHQKLNKWNNVKILSNRMKILNEAISCHMNGDYNASICTLLPQLEGVIVEAVGFRGRVRQKQLIGFVESFLDKVDMTFSMDEAIRALYANIVLDSFEHGMEINSPLSRHAILHGADTEFGYKFNSLRCILLFDYLVDKLNDFMK